MRQFFKQNAEAVLTWIFRGVILAGMAALLYLRTIFATADEVKSIHSDLNVLRDSVNSLNWRMDGVASKFIMVDQIDAKITEGLGEVLKGAGDLSKQVAVLTSVSENTNRRLDEFNRELRELNRSRAAEPGR